MTDQATSGVARAFVTARRGSGGLSAYPGDLPASLAEAYAVQAEAILQWGEPVVGWKVGRITGDQEQLCGENRFVGPVFAGSVWPISASEAATFPVIAGGSAALEAELIARVELPASEVPQEWTKASVRPLVRSWHIGIEVAGSPLADIGDLGPLVSIAAFGNNLGLLLGPQLPADCDVDAVECTAVIDGEATGPRCAGALPGGPLEAIAFALNKLHALGYDLTAETLISTGAITGVHLVSPGQHCRADFSPGGSLECLTQALAGE